MKIIFGVKMIDVSDIINDISASRPGEICNYLKSQIVNNIDITKSFDCNFTIDTSLQGNMPILNIVDPVKIIFIPVDYVEEKIMNDGIASDGLVKFGDLGIFKAVHRKEREGRNPQTQEKIMIPGKDSVVFKVSKMFNGRLNGVEN